MPIIVVEGPDGSGKSTLINNLRRTSKRHFLVLQRANPPKTLGEILTSLTLLASVARARDLTLVCDRHPLISEPIYGHILRGRSLVDKMLPVELSNELTDTTRLIYCRPSNVQIRADSRRELQLAGVEDKIDEIIAAYDEMIGEIENLGIITIHYDWTQQYKVDLEHLFFGDYYGPSRADL